MNMTRILLPVLFCLISSFVFSQEKLPDENPVFDKSQLTMNNLLSSQVREDKTNFMFTRLETGDTLMQSVFEERKSPKISNVFLSLLVPGLGEWASGNKGAAKFFLGMEVTLWAGFIASNSYLNVLQSDLEAFAAQHAGVRMPDEKGDQYWIDVGLSPSIYEFNAERLLERDKNARYEEGSSYDWVWDSEDNRIVYAGKRLDRVDWKKNTNLIIGGLVLNRIISAIDVVRIVRKSKKENDLARKSYLNMRYAENAFEGKSFRLNFSVLF